MLAESVGGLTTKLQREMVEGKLRPLITEWCDTPDLSVPGVAYDDACVLFDQPGQDIVVQVDKGPSENVFIYIPHSLGDPVLESASQDLDQFLAQTFWCNEAVLECFHVAQALAKRGLNIDRCFVGVSPGGGYACTCVS